MSYWGLRHILHAGGCGGLCRLRWCCSTCKQEATAGIHVTCEQAGVGAGMETGWDSEVLGVT